MIFVILALLLAPLVQRQRRSSPAKIVVVQAAKIGDFICSTPLISGLKLAFPEAQISLIASPAVRALAAELPFIDAIIDSPANSTKGLSGKLRWIDRLRQENFDMAFCCNGGVAWPVILALTGIPVRVGLTPNFAGKSTTLAQKLWTLRVGHRADQLIGTSYAKMLSLIGIEHGEQKKVVYATRTAPDKVRRLLHDKGDSPTSLRIGIAISSANKLKELGTPLLIAISQGLLNRIDKATLIFLGTASDSDDAELIARQLSTAPGHHLVNSCGLLSLAEVPALMAHLDVFVGVDSGLTYMADALSIPLVSIAGPCNMRETRPTNASALIIQHDLACVPCAHIFRAPHACHLGTRACIRDITADEVVTTVLRLCTHTSSHGPE